jgi:hypothetical protein
MSYVEIEFEPSAPSANVGVDNNACIIGKVSSFSGESNLVEATTLTELESQGIEESNGGLLWKAARDFFAANGLMPRASKLYAYVFEDGGSEAVTREPMVGKLDGVNAIFKTKSVGVSDLNIYIQWDNGETAILQPTASYEAAFVASGSAVLSGEIEFDDAEDALLVNAVGPTYAAIADIGYGKDYPNAKVLASYTMTGISKILKTLREKDISAFMFAYNENETGMAEDFYSGTSGSWLMDCIIGAKEAALCAPTKPRNFIVTLPGRVKATDTIAAGLRNGIDAFRYEQLGNVIGNMYVVPLAHMDLESSGVPVDNVAAIYMGTIVGQSPLKAGFTLKKLPISQVEFPLQGEVDKWTNASIACIINMPDLYPTENLISYGFTFGPGTSSRIENGRCKMKIGRELKAALYDFIRDPSNFVDPAGCRALNAKISSVFERMKVDVVCDGLKSIVNPLLMKYENGSPTPSDEEYITYYVNNRWIPNVESTFLWRGNPEKISMNVREAAI